MEDAHSIPLLPLGDFASLLVFIDAWRLQSASVKALSLDEIVTALEAVLMEPSRPDPDKILALVFISEECKSLLAQREQLDKVAAFLNDLLYQEFSSEILKSEVLTTLTTVIITLDVFASQSSALETLVESFQVILSFADTVGKPDTILVRAAAAQCLVELEETYPLLLASHLGHALQWTLKDTSHAAQSSMALLQTSLHHKLLELSETLAHDPSAAFAALSNSASSSPPSSSEVEEPLFAVFGAADLFVLPERYRPSALALPPSAASTSGPASADELNFQSVTAPLLASDTLTATNVAAQVHKSATELQRARLVRALPRALKDTRRAVLALAENARLLTSHHSAATALRINTLLPVSDVKRELLGLRFGHFVRSSNPLFLHTSLLLSNVSDWSAAECRVAISRCASRVNDETESPAIRALAAAWLRELLTLPAFASHVVEQRRLLLPSVFDSLVVQEWKLHALLAAAATSSSSTLVEALPALRILEDTRPNSPRDTALLRIFFTLFDRYCPTLEHVEATCSQLERRIASQPRLSSLAVDLLENLPRALTWQRIREHLASFFINERALASRGDFIHCVPIFQRLLQEPSVKPEALLHVLLTFLRTSPVCDEGAWSAGTSLLDLAQQVLMQPQVSEHSRQQLASLLSILEAQFYHVDVRDRAHLYYVLATHLEPERVRDLLDTSKTLTEARSVTVPLTSTSSASSATNLDAVTASRFATLVQLARVSVEGNDLAVLSLGAKVSNGGNSSTDSEEAMSLPVSLDFTLDSISSRAVNCPRVYSLHITFTPSDALLAAAPSPLTIPTLALGDSSRCTLRFVPRLPLPTTLAVRAEFNDAEGRVHSVPLPALKIFFVDLLSPFSAARDSFESLWARSIEVSELSAESVRVIALERSLALRRIEALWRPFIVDSRRDDVTGDELLRLATFLPPKEQLLYQMRLTQRDIRIEIRTSYWRLLAHVDAWLDHLLGAS